jgi:hypothetical protein
MCQKRLLKKETRKTHHVLSFHQQNSFALVVVKAENIFIVSLRNELKIKFMEFFDNFSTN